MLGQRIHIASSAGAQIPLDLYVSEVSQEIDENIQRPSVVICPGGGYEFLSSREAEPVALSFVASGFNAFVVWYRVAPARYPLPQQDAAAAVAYVRAHAKELHCNPGKSPFWVFRLAAIWRVAWARCGKRPGCGRKWA